MKHRIKKIGLGGAGNDAAQLAARARRGNRSIEEQRAIEDRIRAEGDAIRARMFPDRDAPSKGGGSS